MSDIAPRNIEHNNQIQLDSTDIGSKLSHEATPGHVDGMSTRSANQRVDVTDSGFPNLAIDHSEKAGDQLRSAYATIEKMRAPSPDKDSGDQIIGTTNTSGPPDKSKENPTPVADDKSEPGWYKYPNGTEYHRGDDGKVDRYEHGDAELFKDGDNWYYQRKGDQYGGPVSSVDVDKDGNVHYKFDPQWYQNMIDAIEKIPVIGPIESIAFKALGIDHNYTLGSDDIPGWLQDLIQR